MSNLPKDRIILYLTIYKDGAGKTYSPRDALFLLSRNANAPIYGISDTYLGYGITGGNLVSFNDLSTGAAEIVIQILSGKKPSEIPAKPFKNKNYYAWNELKRWKINETKLPENSIVFNKPPNLLDNYKWQISGVLFFFGFAAIVIVALFIQLRLKKKAESELRISAERWSNTFNSITDIVLVISTDHIIQEINEIGCKFLSMKRYEIIGRKCHEPMHCKSSPIDVCPCNISLKTKKMSTCEYFEKGHWYFLTAWPIFNDNNEVIALSHAIRDITDSKISEEARKENEYFLKRSQEIAMIGYFKYNPKTEEVGGSDVLFQIFGLTREEFQFSDFVNSVHPDQRGYVTDIIKSATENKGSYKIEHYLQLRDGTIKYVKTIGETILDEKGDLLLLIGTVQDITERKKDEDVIKTSLKDKEILLSELYHRTRNNMQVISSFLQLHALYKKDDSIENLVSATISRINAMSLVHEKLHARQDLSKIDLGDYIHDLVDMIIQNNDLITENKVVVYNLDKVETLFDIALPCGLVVNELVINVLKHEFTGQDKGEIKIKLNRNKEDYIVLQISDNGIGIDKNTDLRNIKSFV